MQEVGYLKVAWLRHIRYHGALLWNGITGDWSSVSKWFGTCCAPAARMQAHGLVYALFVAQATWFGMPYVCCMKGGWVEHGIQGYEICDSNNV